MAVAPLCPGLQMKTMAGMFLWALIIGYFIQYAKQFRNSHDYRRNSSNTPEEADEGPLTTADVEAAFARTAPAREED